MNLRTMVDLLAERDRQDERFGEQNHPDGTGGPGDLAAAEWARRRCERATADQDLTWRDVLTEEVAEALAESDPTRLRAELVQVAAVCVCWIEALDRRQKIEGA